MDHVYQMVYTHPIKSIWRVTNFNKNAISVTKYLRMGSINSQSQTIFIPLVLGEPFQILYFKSKKFTIIMSQYKLIPYFPQNCVLSLASCFKS